MKYLLVAVISFTSLSALANIRPLQTYPVQEQLAALEKNFTGKIGVYALDTNNNRTVTYRADERFPVQSTCKLMGVAALLKLSDKNKALLREKINYTKRDLISWHPVTGKYVASGMTLEALSAAAMSYSDNPAMNLIMRKLGGPQLVADFAYSIDNKTFNIEHYEGELNSNPENKEDTSTPRDMAISLQKLTLGNLLTASKRMQLITWMRENTTGYKRIRASVPIGWVVADKTGSGEYGVANDIGLLWSPLCKPIVLSIYTVQNKPEAKSRDDIVATTTQIVLNELAKHNKCFNMFS